MRAEFVPGNWKQTGDLVSRVVGIGNNDDPQFHRLEMSTLNSQGKLTPLPFTADSPVSCWAWEDTPSRDTNRVFLGTPCGKTLLYQLNKPSPQSTYALSHTQTCSSIASRASSLCTGHSAGVSANCIIWDVENNSFPSSQYHFEGSVRALEWIHDHQIAVAADNNIALVDTRVSSESMNKQILGSHELAIIRVQNVPLSEYQLSSYCVSGVVRVWDTRMDRGMLFESKGFGSISSLDWSPLYQSVAAVTADKTCFVVEFGGSDQFQILEHHETNVCVWDQMFPLVLLDLVRGQEQVQSIPVLSDVSLEWSPQLRISHTNHLRERKSGQPTSKQHLIMQEKTARGYALGNLSETQLLRNATLSDSKDLREFWEWLELNKDKIVGKGSKGKKGLVSKSGPSKRMIGVRGIKELLNSSTGLASGEISRNLLPNVQHFETPQRRLCLSSLGWSQLSDSDAVVERNLPLFQTIALLVFNLDIPKALQVLSEHPCPTNSALSMALAGCPSSTTPNQLWETSVAQLTSQLDHVYISALFAFLTDSSQSFTEILDNEELSFSDRIAFAIRFLPDNQLTDYLDRLSSKSLRSGRVMGLCIHGFASQTSLPILSRYTELSGDLQSAAIISCMLLDSEESMRWVEEYRRLLDQWKLWDFRAKFDQHRNVLRMNVGLKTIVPAAINVKCTFCNQSLTNSVKKVANPKGLGRFTASHKTEGAYIRCCPHCRKPLPRCCVCLMGLTISPPSPQTAVSKHVTPRPIDEWIVWCQQCKHGGHNKHLHEWFSVHNECPVPSCSCICSSGR